MTAHYRLPSGPEPSPPPEPAARLSRAPSATAGFYRRTAKRGLDVLAILILLLVVLPVILLLALLVMRDGSAPFCSQTRIGRGGRPFKMWKLRSTIADAGIRPADPRITPFGHFLRRSALDDLPQLWNVLKGDMSLVGPRPMTPDQALRHPGEACCRLRPGITGVWQVSGRDAPTLADRARCNATYEQNLSLATDLQILAATVRIVLREADH